MDKIRRRLTNYATQVYTRALALVNKLRSVIPLSFLVLLMGLTPSERGESNEYDNDSVFVDYHILHRRNSWFFFNEITIF